MKARDSGARPRRVAGAVGAVVKIVAAWCLLAMAVGAIWTFVGVMSSPGVCEAIRAPGGAP